MRKFYSIFPALFILVFTLFACSTPPVEEMNNAMDAVTRAENDADTVAFAPNALVNARNALTRMQEEADAKRYDAAKNFAAEAISIAERAVTEGKAGAARVRDEASDLISRLSGTLSETASAVNAARDAQDIQLDFDSISRDLSLANRTYEDAMQSYQANKFRNAIAEGQTVRSLLSDINARISGAAQIVSRKK